MHASNGSGRIGMGRGVWASTRRAAREAVRGSRNVTTVMGHGATIVLALSAQLHLKKTRRSIVVRTMARRRARDMRAQQVAAPCSQGPDRVASTSRAAQQTTSRVLGAQDSRATAESRRAAARLLHNPPRRGRWSACASKGTNVEITMRRSRWSTFPGTESTRRKSSQAINAQIAAAGLVAPRE